MQILSRRLFQHFLTKNTLQSLSCTAGVHYNLTSAINKPKDDQLRSYSSKPGQKKQKLLAFPAIPLEETITKFMKSAEPFLSKEELEENRKQAKIFLRCDGPKLQKLLMAEAARNENWLADRWLRTAYMQYRDPVVIFSSPGMAFPPVCFSNDEEYLHYTAKVIYALIKFKELIDAGKIPVVKIGHNELDNSQFGKVLGTCRIPFLGEDIVKYYPNSTHVAVIYNNHFYKLTVYSKDFKPLHPDVICEQLKKIYETEKNAGVPFGILSSDKRDNWARAYDVLINIKGNKEGVESIQKSLFTVSLDGEVCLDSSSNKNNVLGGLLIHGCGSKMYSANRWFDKTIQLIISRSGMQGFCYEHSPAEGQPIALMVDYVVKNLDNEKLLVGAECSNFVPAQKIVLESSPALDSHILTAKANLDKLVEDFQLNVMIYKEYGKSFLKDQKLSPDSFVQMALQYGFYKLHKVPAATYESAHLRIFANGRTETIRSCSNESMAFVKAMDEPNTDAVRVDLLRKAVNAHRQYTTMALQGKGVDRHLLGLKLMAIENKLPIPPFYSQQAFKRSCHFRLSSSQVATAFDAFMCYGPMYYDGYACCYNPRADDMILSFSAWYSNRDTCADKFGASVSEALDEMHSVLCRVGKPAEKPAAKPKAKL